MKKNILIIILGMVFINAYAQQEEALDEKATRQLTKEQKIERKLAQEEYTANLVDSMVKKGRFVLEADFLSDQKGYRVIVSGNINFIMVDSNEVTIQIASNNRFGGQNGMGGITTTGTVTNYEVKKMGKGRGYLIVKMSTITAIGSYDILIHVSPNANADATISGITYGKVNYHGVVKPLEGSSVYKGRSI